MGKVLNGDIKTALRSLQRNKGRSLLTMFGIVIGVASVVTVMAVGQGVQRQVSDQTQRLGKDLITVRPGQVPQAATLNDLFANSDAAASVQTGGEITAHDIEVIGKTPGVQRVVSLSVVAGGVALNNPSRHFNVPVVGSDSGLPEMLNKTLAYGSFFDQSMATANKVVLGSHLAHTLYEQNVPLGQTLTILGREFIVVGIFNDFETIPFIADIDFNNAAYITNDTAQSLTSNHALVYEVLVRPEQLRQTKLVMSNLSDALLNAHGGQHNFSVLQQGQTVVASAIQQLLTALIGGMAVISLLVGGVGIMNVMLVSVTERMHEIGIRKAVGATNRQILMQFIIEAGLLSVTGAVIGVILSGILAVMLRIYTNLNPVISWQVVAIACTVSVLSGIIFGTAPAIKASRKEPISALRNE